MNLDNRPIEISPINLPLLNNKKVLLYLLRLDRIHPIISGNKWFKLKYNLREAKQKNNDALISFGGAYSNHLAAFSYASRINGFKSIAIIRGFVDEKSLSPTLKFLKQNGTHLHFVSRKDYKRIKTSEFLNSLSKTYPNSFIIPEGGNNEFGLKGCIEIGDLINEPFDYVAVSVGTGTTLKGLLLNPNLAYKKVLGFCSLKGKNTFDEEISLLKEIKHAYQIISVYNFGGFGKFNGELINFVNYFYHQTKIELDIVYTAKMMYGILNQIQNDFFEEGTKILAIHTGGTQGNEELKIKGLLKF